MGDYRDKSGSERVDAPEKIDLTMLCWMFIMV